MASLVARLWTRLVAKRASLSIMIVGLDNSGKTSVLNNLASLSGSNNSINSNNQLNKSAQDNPSSNITNEANLVKSNITSDRISSNESQSLNIMPTVGYNYERIQYKGMTITVLDFSGQNRYRNLWQEFYNGVDAIVFVIDSSDIIRFVVVRDEIETMLSHPYFITLQQSQQQQKNQSEARQQVDLKREQLYPSSNATLYPQKQITVSQGKLIQTLIDTSSASHPVSSLSSPFSTNLKASSNEASKNSMSGKRGHFSSAPRRRIKVPILFLANKADLPNSVDTEVIAKALNLNELSKERHPWFIQATSVNLSQGIVDGFDWLINQLSN